MSKINGQIDKLSRENHIQPDTGLVGSKKKA